MTQDLEVDIGQVYEAIIGLDKLGDPAFFEDRVVTTDPGIPVWSDSNRIT